jgi:hypothetical protein
MGAPYSCANFLVHPCIPSAELAAVQRSIQVGTWPTVHGTAAFRQNPGVEQSPPPAVGFAKVKPQANGTHFSRRGKVVYSFASCP